PWRKAIPRLCTVQGSATVSNQLSLRVVDRDNQAAAKQSWSRIKPNSKIDCGLVVNASSCEIRMSAVDAAQSESKRQRLASFFRNQFFRIRKAQIDGYRNESEFFPSITQSTGFHRCHKVQDSSTSPAGEAVKDIPSQVPMKGVAAFAAMNWTAP